MYENKSQFLLLIVQLYNQSNILSLKCSNLELLSRIIFFKVIDKYTQPLFYHSIFRLYQQKNSKVVPNKSAAISESSNVLEKVKLKVQNAHFFSRVVSFKLVTNCLRQPQHKHNHLLKDFAYFC